MRTLAGRIPLILDGGPTSVGLESTIIAVDGEVVRLLRPGPILVNGAGTVSAGGSKPRASSKAIMRRASRCASASRQPSRTNG
jgi:L-threonylcarbamoyladenylate synthase